MYVDPTVLVALALCLVSLMLWLLAACIFYHGWTRNLAALSAADEAEIQAWCALDAKLCRMNRDPHSDLLPRIRAAERQLRELRRFLYLCEPVADRYMVAE